MLKVIIALKICNALTVSKNVTILQQANKRIFSNIMFIYNKQMVQLVNRVIVI